MCCASCGIKASDDIKLQKCTAYNLVKYCGVKCQREHRSQHERECKKRVAELRDEILFRQPESTNDGDCPICFLPLPIDQQKQKSTATIILAFCSQAICDGCFYANRMREIEQSLQHRCPFCRHPAGKTKEAWKEENKKGRMKRVEANDPVAMRELGSRYYDEWDYGSAIKYWRKAAELGDVVAHYQMSVMYWEGKGVQKKDTKKSIYHAE